MDQRQLASFRVLGGVIPHPNADNLEIALVDGWKCIVKKGDFKAGDRVIYFEIDSLLPIIPQFEFLRKYAYVNKAWMPKELGVSEGFRIKTIKLRGEISQGLVVPVPKNLELVTDSYDLTEHFRVLKYEVPLSKEFASYFMPGSSGKFPSFFPKTGETRVQNKFSSIQENKNRMFEVTRKYHGMSISFYAKLADDLSFFERTKLTLASWFGFDMKPIYRYGVCSHNVELKLNYTGNTFVDFANNSGIMQMLANYVESSPGLPEIALQGEICGPGIQDNHHGLDEITVYIFNIFDIKENRYLLPEERSELFEKVVTDKDSLIKEALVEFYTTVGDRTVDEILALGEFTLPSGKPNEGFVWKAMTCDFSFKAISNEFLLSKNEQDE